MITIATVGVPRGGVSILFWGEEVDVVVVRCPAGKEDGMLGGFPTGRLRAVGSEHRLPQNSAPKHAYPSIHYLSAVALCYGYAFWGSGWVSEHPRGPGRAGSGVEVEGRERGKGGKGSESGMDLGRPMYGGAGSGGGELSSDSDGKGGKELSPPKLYNHLLPYIHRLR